MGLEDLLHGLTVRHFFQNQIDGDAVPATTGLPIITAGSELINGRSTYTSTSRLAALMSRLGEHSACLIRREVPEAGDDGVVKPLQPTVAET